MQVRARFPSSAPRVKALFKVGMRVPGVAAVATVRGHGEKMFVAVHGDTPRGVRVHMEGAPWDEWIVGCADPEAFAATLAAAS